MFFMSYRKSVKVETLISYKKFVKVEILISYKKLEIKPCGFESRIRDVCS